MKTFYEVRYIDGLGNPRRWGLYRSEERTLAGMKRMHAFGIKNGSVRIVEKPSTVRRAF